MRTLETTANLESAAVSASPWYHVTPLKNLVAIQRDGLKPIIGARARKLGEGKAAIYLFASICDAEDALMNWLGQEFSEDACLALLAVKVPETVDLIPGAGFERVIAEAIPPQNIKVMSRDVLGEADLSRLTAGEFSGHGRSGDVAVMGGNAALPSCHSWPHPEVTFLEAAMTTDAESPSEDAFAKLNLSLEFYRHPDEGHIVPRFKLTDGDGQAVDGVFAGNTHSPDVQGAIRDIMNKAYQAVMGQREAIEVAFNGEAPAPRM